MTRREFPKAVKLAAFQRAAGRCEECTSRLITGTFHYDHELPDALGGEPNLSNCRVLCRSCHSAKTGKEDIPRIAKSNRVRLRHAGIRKRGSFRTNRDQPLKKKISGEVVPRYAKAER